MMFYYSKFTILVYVSKALEQVSVNQVNEDQTLLLDCVLFLFSSCYYGKDN